MLRDPICGMEVYGEEFYIEFKKKRYFFCSAGCKDKFKNSPDVFLQRYIYDLVIIGGGPAGLTAAVYASALKIDTFLLAKDIGGQAIDSSKIKNYMGFDFISGKELITKFKYQFLQEHFLEHKIDEAIRVDAKKRNFEIFTKAQNRFSARSIIIATGMKRRRLGIPGEERLQRKGVSYSSVQDIAFFKGLDIVVVGGGNSGVQTANDLLQLDCAVTLISQGKLTADKDNINLLKKNKRTNILEGYDIIEIRGESNVEEAVVQSRSSLGTTSIPCRAIFIQVGLLPNTEFCQNLLKLNEKGEIMISPDCSTNVKGVFACGDATNCFGKRIIIASGEGAKAALSASRYLLNKKA